MRLEELSEPMQKKLRELKHASSTIQNDIGDAVGEAANEQEFIKLATSRLHTLIGEANGWIDWLIDWLRALRLY